MLCNLIKCIDKTGKIDQQKGYFRDSEYLCKLGKEYLKHCYASFILFSRKNLQTFDISHAVLPQTIAKLSTFKNGPVSLAHRVYPTQVNKKRPEFHWRLVLTTKNAHLAFQHVRSELRKNSNI